MSLQTTDELQKVAELLPDGSTLVVHEFAWEDYERLLDALTVRPHLRVCYDAGTLEIVSPLPEHERHARFIDDLVRAFCDRRGVDLEKLGQATWKRRALAKGVEADACYYVRSAKHIIGKQEIDLEVDPPPDIAVEIDVSGDSARKLSIYAALAVPELWIYDGETVRILILESGLYIDRDGSDVLPGLTRSMLAESLHTSKSEGQTRALQAFRKALQVIG